MSLHPLPTHELIPLLSGAPEGTPPYKGDELLSGLNAERDRLGSRPFLILVHQHVFDYDGLTEYVYLMDTFDTQREAEAAADDLSQRVLAVEVGAGKYGKTWGLESESNSPYLPKPGVKTGVRPLFDRAFKVRGGDYDTRHTSVRVVGPFSGVVVDLDLLEFVNAKHELWSYFVDVGESVMHNKPRRAPGRKFDD